MKRKIRQRMAFSKLRLWIQIHLWSIFFEKQRKIFQKYCSYVNKFYLKYFRSLVNTKYLWNYHSYSNEKIFSLRTKLRNHRKPQKPNLINLKPNETYWHPPPKPSYKQPYIMKGSIEHCVILVFNKDYRFSRKHVLSQSQCR